MPRCPCCSMVKTSLVHHYARSTQCREAAQKAWGDDTKENQNPSSCNVNSCVNSLYHNILKEMVSDDLAELRYGSYVPDSEIERMLRLVRHWLGFAGQELKQLITPFAKAGGGATNCIERIVDNCLDIFSGLETPALRRSYLERTKPYIKPVIRPIKGVGHVVDLPLVSTLTRLLQHSDSARKACIERSEEWKKGDKWRKEADLISDVDCGNNVRFHPELMRPALPHEANDLRIALGFYGDGIEVHPYAPCTALDPHSDRFVFCAAMQFGRPVAREEQDDELVLQGDELTPATERLTANASASQREYSRRFQKGGALSNSVWDRQGW